MNLSLNTLILPDPMATQSESRWAYCFRQLEHWNHGFESYSRHEFVRVFLCCVVLCVGRSLALGQSPFQGVLPTVQYGKR